MKVPDSNMSQPVLSIIIISFNTRTITLDCLQSIVKSRISVPYEIIVFDNASSDGTQKAITELAKKYTQIHLVENRHNIGFGKGNNEAVKLAKGGYILLLNTDIVVLDDAIDKLLTYYREHETTIHFVGGKLYNKDMTPQVSRGLFFTLPVVLAFIFLQGDKRGWTRNSPDTATPAEWVSGACILTKKSHFEALGGFDTDIFMYMEEVDLLYRAHKQHLRTYFYPEAHFIHLGAASSNRTYPILQVYKGLLFFYKKHYSPLAFVILKFMLQLKARIAILVGRTTKNLYLIQTYEEAYKVATLA